MTTAEEEKKTWLSLVDLDLARSPDSILDAISSVVDAIFLRIKLSLLIYPKNVFFFSFFLFKLFFLFNLRERKLLEKTMNNSIFFFWIFLINTPFILFWLRLTSCSLNSYHYGSTVDTNWSNWNRIFDNIFSTEDIMQTYSYLH